MNRLITPVVLALALALSSVAHAAPHTGMPFTTEYNIELPRNSV